MAPRTMHRRQRTYAPDYHDPYFQPPQRRSVFETLFFAVGAVFLAGAMYLLFWPVVRPYVGALTPPPAVGVPSAPRSAAPPVAAPQAQPAEAPAAPVAQPVEAPAPAQPATLPTAAVAVPTPITVVQPIAAPLRLAPGSVAPTAAPAPTVATTAMMQVGKDFTANADGTCVQTTRDGAAVQFCQARPMSLAELSSVADYLRTGMIAGEPVK